MKTWRLTSGTINGILFIVMMVQSCAAGVINSLSKSSDSSGTIGMICAALLLVAGVLSIAFRNNPDEGHVILICLYGAAAVLGIFFHGVYEDLFFWGCWGAICAAVTLVLMLKHRNHGAENVPVLSENGSSAGTKETAWGIAPPKSKRAAIVTWAFVALSIIALVAEIIALVVNLGFADSEIAAVLPFWSVYAALGGSVVSGVVAWILAENAYA